MFRFQVKHDIARFAWPWLKHSLRLHIDDELAVSRALMQIETAELDVTERECGLADEFFSELV